MNIGLEDLAQDIAFSGSKKRSLGGGGIEKRRLGALFWAQGLNSWTQDP